MSATAWVLWGYDHRLVIKIVRLPWRVCGKCRLTPRLPIFCEELIQLLKREATYDYWKEEVWRVKRWCTCWDTDDPNHTWIKTKTENETRRIPIGRGTITEFDEKNLGCPAWPRIGGCQPQEPF